MSLTDVANKDLTTMRLNIGCGNNKLDGYVNVDQFAGCQPDLQCNLEQIPWPFPDDSASEIRAHHVLEHLGQSTDTFLAIVKEIYRVCRHGGILVAAVPHPLHNSFLTDPTHVRRFTGETFLMLSRQHCLDWTARKVNVTPLALMIDVNFVPDLIEQVYDRYWIDQLKKGEVTHDELRERSRREAGIIREIRVRLRVDKSHLGRSDGSQVVEASS